jgi:hypothetical protein
MVARIVKRYRIPLVILNACHSATADSGANASMAHHFLKRDVQNVVGMSFKISHAAATIFLYNFYYAMLIDGLPISMSAGIARMSARVQINRRARYGLQRDLRDGFVPVLYGAPDAAHFGNPRNPRSTAEEIYFAKLSELSHRRGLSFYNRLWYGGDFDLLRLERLLCHSSTIYLHGLAGVGKSFLVDSAMRLWKDTNYMDITITVDFQYRAEVSYTNLLMDIIVQIKDQEYESGPIKLAVGSTRLPKTEASIDDDTEKAIIEIVKKLHSTIIIKGIEIFPISPIPQLIADSDTGQILPFLRQLVQLATGARRDKRLHIIFAHRRADPTGTEDLIGYKFGPYRYALLPLDLPDAMEFATDRDGEDTQHWKSEDIDHLESTLTLLQCIPGALSAALHVRHRKPWSEFYQRLRHGLFPCMEKLELDLTRGFDALRDFQDLSITPPHQFFMFCLLGLFWKVAPPIHYLLPIFDAIAPPPIKQAMERHGQENMIFAVQVFQQLVLDRGYVTRSSDGMTLHIHPMYTIVAQTELKRHLTIGNRVTLAARFGAAIETYVSRHAMSIIDELWLPNYLTVMDACIKEVPVAVWPLSFMGVCCIKSTQYIPRATRSQLYNRNIDLLHELTFKLRLLDDKTSHLAFFAFCLLHLSFVSVAFDDVKQHRLLDLAEQGTNKLMIQDSLLDNDGATLISIYQGLCLITWALTLVFRDEFGAFSERVEDLRCLTVPFNVSDEEVHNYATKLQSTEQDSEVAYTQTQTIRNLQIWMKFILHVFDALEIQIQREKQTTSRHRSPPAMAVLPVSVPARPVQTGQRARKAQQLQASLDSILPEQQEQAMNAADWQWTLYRTQMILLLDINDESFDHPTESSSHTHHIERIHNIQEEEDWFSVCIEQMELVFDSLSREQLRTANAHLQAIQTILNRADVPEELIQSATRCHSRICDAWYTLTCKNTLFPESLTGMIPDMVRSSICPDEDAASVTEWMLYLMNHHIQEASMMKQATRNVIENKFIDALGLLRQLGDRFDVIMSGYPQAKEHIRAVQRIVLLFAKYLNIVQEVYHLALRDVDEAKRSIPGHVALLEGFPDSHLQTVANELHLLIAKHEFVCCRINILQQAAGSSTHLQRNLFKNILHNFQMGNFQALHHLEVVVDTRISVIKWLMDDAVKMKWWAKALAYCADYKAHGSLSLQQDTDAKAAIFHIEEECRWNLVLASLDRAEATLRFSRCIKLVEYMSKLKRWSSSLRGIPRWTFWDYPDKVVAVLKETYKQRCLRCARWLRNMGHSAPVSGRIRIKRIYRTHPQALLRDMQMRRIFSLYKSGKKKKGMRVGTRTNRHRCNSVREMFRQSAFGCAHHCKGHYCF